MNDAYIYDWHGHLIGAHFYEGRCEVSSLNNAPMDEIPEGETFVQFGFHGGSVWDPVWVPETKFLEHADPVSVDALKREGEWG